MIKYIIFLSIIVWGVSSVNAQNDYLLNYGPGSAAWCWQMQQQNNIISMQTAMMRAQLLNYYQQQAAAATQWMQTNPCTPMSGMVTYDGVSVTPETVNNYHKEKVPCEHCDGGFNYRMMYMGGGETRRVKIRCSWCHGNGYVTKTVMDE